MGKLKFVYLQTDKTNMTKLILLLSIVLLNGCAYLEARQAEMLNDAAKKDAIADEEAAKETFKESLWKVGTAEETFFSAWGEPEGKILDGNFLIALFDTPKGPYKFYFSKKLLSGWAPNYEKQAALTNEQRLQREEESSQSNAWMGAAAAFNQMNTQNQINQIQNEQRQLNYQQKTMKNLNGQNGRVLVNPGH